VPGCGGGPGCMHQLKGQALAGAPVGVPGGAVVAASGGIGTAVVGGAPLAQNGMTGAGAHSGAVVAAGAQISASGVVVAGGMQTATAPVAGLPPGFSAGNGACGVPGCTVAENHMHHGPGSGVGPGAGQVLAMVEPLGTAAPAREPAANSVAARVARSASLRLTARSLDCTDTSRGSPACSILIPR
jgi:hypothetical protein